jgi:hypothetical protein
MCGRYIDSLTIKLCCMNRSLRSLRNVLFWMFIRKFNQWTRERLRYSDIQDVKNIVMKLDNTLNPLIHTFLYHL